MMGRMGRAPWSLARGQAPSPTTLLRVVRCAGLQQRDLSTPRREICWSTAWNWHLQDPFSKARLTGACSRAPPPAPPLCQPLFPRASFRAWSTLLVSAENVDGESDAGSSVARDARHPAGGDAALTSSEGEVGCSSLKLRPLPIYTGLHVERSEIVRAVAAGDVADPVFARMVERYASWVEAYGSPVIPRSVFDQKDLAEFVWLLRRRVRRGTAPREVQDIVDTLQMSSKPTVLPAAWWHCFHRARQFKARHGHLDFGRVVEQEEGGAVDWKETEEWMKRQHVVYSQQKMPLQQVHALKNILGVTLHRSYAPKKKKRHPVLDRIDNAYLEQLGFFPSSRTSRKSRG